jgi:hypothetical protein
MPNKALQQNRDEVLRCGESIGCDLLKAAVRQQEAQSQSQEMNRLCLVAWATTVTCSGRKAMMRAHWGIAVSFALLLCGCGASPNRSTGATDLPPVAPVPMPEVKQFEWGLGKIAVGMKKDDVLREIKATWKRPSDDPFTSQDVDVPGVSEPPSAIQPSGRWELRYGVGSGAAPGGGGITLVFEADTLIQIVVMAVSA